MQVGRQPRDPRIRASLSLAYAYLGLKEKAILEATLATDMQPVSRDAVSGPGFVQNLAIVYTLIGEYDAALERLDYLLSIPCDVSPAFLLIHPQFAPLQKHPGFHVMLEKYR